MGATLWNMICLFVIGWRGKPHERGCGGCALLGTHAVNVLLGLIQTFWTKRSIFSLGTTFLPVNVGNWGSGVSLTLPVCAGSAFRFAVSTKSQRRLIVLEKTLVKCVQSKYLLNRIDHAKSPQNTIFFSKRY